MSDFEFERVVHAVMHDGSEIVRYDRAGKWYREFADGKKREPLTVSEAAWYGERAQIRFPRQYGGAVFNRLVLKSDGKMRR